jgi:single-strand DNA-binding protein
MEPQLPLQGNLVQDPTQQVVGNGLRITRFRMASSGRRFDRASGEWVNTDPVYLTVVCWRQLGDNVMQSLRKGDSVVVIGRLTYREWDDPNGGGRRNRYELDAAAVGPDLSRYVAQLSRPLRELPESVPVVRDDLDRAEAAGVEAATATAAA